MLLQYIDTLGRFNPTAFNHLANREPAMQVSLARYEVFFGPDFR
ncbi:hypothetical protein CBM2604_A140104 [Cupriavidus taiwanensis]|nr:hypothetical protein CBM2604_A140104 [Cupriavidus taiwanensis]